nr:aldehyde ferredoxin oxidoreductase C-terminal domain-containing protein [Desulfobacula sp.]
MLAFAIELYEAGILTDEGLPNFPKTGRERFFYLIKIIHREGIGNILADGVYHAARQIGKEAEQRLNTIFETQDKIANRIEQIKNQIAVL